MTKNPTISVKTILLLLSLEDFRFKMKKEMKDLSCLLNNPDDPDPADRITPTTIPVLKSEIFEISQLFMH